MKKIILYIAVMLTLLSCEEKIDFEIKSRETIRLVVEGMITNERRAHEVKLSLPIRDLNEIPTPVSGALVAITDQENVFLLKENSEEPGVYLTTPDIQGVFGKLYTLYIRVADFEFTGNSFMVPVEPIQSLTIISCENEDNQYSIETQQIGDPFMMEIMLDWSSYADCSEGICQARMMEYHLNSVDVNEIFKPQQEVVCFPAGTVIKRKKYSLNPDYQSYIRAMMNETNWRGGYFDVERGNIPTNMSTGAIGYFAAASVVSDSTLFQP
jgi:hypothetical protein